VTFGGSKNLIHIIKLFKTIVMERKNGEDPNSGYHAWCRSQVLQLWPCGTRNVPTLLAACLSWPLGYYACHSLTLLIIRYSPLSLFLTIKHISPNCYVTCQTCLIHWHFLDTHQTIYFQLIYLSNTTWTCTKRTNLDM
jgi:hypothetical protein